MSQSGADALPDLGRRLLICNAFEERPPDQDVELISCSMVMLAHKLSTEAITCHLAVLQGVLALTMQTGYQELYQVPTPKVQSNIGFRAPGSSGPGRGHGRPVPACPPRRSPVCPPACDWTRKAATQTGRRDRAIASLANVIRFSNPRYSSRWMVTRPRRPAREAGAGRPAELLVVSRAHSAIWTSPCQSDSPGFRRFLRD